MRVVTLGKRCLTYSVRQLSLIQHLRIRNKAKLKPIELADPRNEKLRDMLRKAEFSFMAGDDVVVEDEDDGPTGSASDSD
jgi:hypothetical protein